MATPSGFLNMDPSRYGLAWLALLVLFAACTGEDMQSSPSTQPPPGVLRTPEERFANLRDFPFQPQYATVDGMRMHFIDENPTGRETVVLLHGEPTWSYLYRKMIPILVDAGFRVIAPDLIGFGRSDKPVSLEDYSYARHVDWTRSLLLDTLGLSDITLFGQDWGGLIGLRLVGEHPERFSRVIVANTWLPTGDESPTEGFLRWQRFAQQLDPFDVAPIIQGATVRELTPDELRAYEAPFPDESYKAGARVFPRLVPTTPDDPASPANRAAWTALERFDRPFLTLFSDRDPVTVGLDRSFQDRVPGARGQPHRTLSPGAHFLQEDVGEELAEAIRDFVQRTPVEARR
jgi:haloalkane dehalogenase